MPSAGRIYQRGAYYFIAYSCGGHEFRESSRSTGIEDARRLLTQRLAECHARTTPGVLFEDLCRLYLDEYTLRQCRTTNTAVGRVKHLRAFFGRLSATAITTALIQRYQATRRRVAAAATVNRETAALRRMCRLAVAAGRLAAAPTFPAALPENPPRQGFFEHAEYLAVRQHLPPPYQDILDFAYYSGWRRREITELTWGEVDLAGGVIRLDPRRSKTRTGRVLPLSPPLAAVLRRRRVDAPAPQTRVFQRDGVQVRSWRSAWREACQRAGLPGRWLHDCRRTAARNLIRAGVPERVAMTLLGHATRSIFDRYHIVNERDLKEAGDRLTRYLHETDQAVAQRPA